MEKQLTKVFLTIVILIVGAVLESYSIDFINVHDDIISMTGALSSVVIILLMVYSGYRLWFKKTEVKEETKENN